MEITMVMCLVRSESKGAISTLLINMPKTYYKNWNKNGHPNTLIYQNNNILLFI